MRINKKIKILTKKVKHYQDSDSLAKEVNTLISQGWEVVDIKVSVPQVDGWYTYEIYTVIMQEME